MDYNDNDYEGQNLHLAGEDSSKISSVLCPYALPKFDFDDSLQGHLRFDSLVENEVFLGIASQEDNQWIEDFSRGSSGIEFHSSAAESCSLPRRNNVWSEATSSESVEMLLKAVGQEEMVPGEAIVEETDPGDQYCGMMEPMESNLKHDDKIVGTQDPNQSLTPGEHHRDASVLNQSAGDPGVHVECSLHAEGMKDTADDSLEVDSEKSSSGETWKNLRSDSECINDGQGEPNASRDKMQEILSVPGIQNDIMESSLQKVTVSVGELNDLDKGCDVKTVSLSGLDKDIFKRSKLDKKELNTDDEMMGGSDAETVNSKLGAAFGVASETGSIEERVVETSKFENPSRVMEKGDSLQLTLERCKEDCDDPGDGSIRAAVALSVGTEVKQQISGENKLDKGSSVSIQPEGCIEHSTEGRKADALEICSKSELKKASAIPSPDGQRSSIDKEDIYHGSNNLLEASPSTFEASTLSEVQGNPSEQDNETLVNPANKLDNLTVTSVAGGCVGENPINEDKKDADDDPGMHTKVLNDDDDHNGSSILSGSMQIYEETNPSMQTDSLKCDQGLSAGQNQKGDEKSHFAWNDMGCDNNVKEVGFTIPGEGVKENIDSVPGSASKIHVGEHPVLNTEMEDTNVASQVEDHNEELELPLNDVESVHKDENEETELKVPAEPRISILGGTLEMTEKPTPVSEPQKASPCDSAVEAGFKTVNQSIPVMETADAATCDKASQKSENLEACPVSEMIVEEGNGSESAPFGKPMDKRIERNHGATSLIDPGTGGSAEIDQSNQVSSSGISCCEHTQSKRDEQESLQGNVAENVHKSEGETRTHPGSKDVSTEDGTFTFDVEPLACRSKGEPGKSSQSFPNIQAQKISLAVEGTLSTSSNRQVDVKLVPEISHRNPLALDGRAPPGGLKGPSERKARRGSGKSVKESGKKGVKETIPLKQNERGEKSHVSLSPSVTGQLMQLEIGNVERGATKASGNVSVPTSDLPDLNSSAPASVLFRQPFTDLQQVQLRAQIFVYGSLIQGAAPDEACMASAFDGGKGIWEHSWRACVERIHNKKSQGNISETPVQSRSVAKASDQASKQGLSQSKVPASSAGRASGKASLSTAFNSTIPLSSPLWNISTPSGDGLPSNVSRSAIFDYQAVSPLHPYQTPPIRSFVSPTTSWPSQAPVPGPWVASSQSSAFDIGPQYSVFPVTEPVKLTPVKELSIPITSGAKHASPIPVAHSGVSSTSAVPFSLVDMKKASVSSSHNSTGTKTRKRKKTSGAEDLVQSSAAATQRDLVSAPVLDSHLSKKAPVVENLNQFSLLARSEAETVPALNVSSHYSTSVTITTPSTFVPKSNADKFLVAASPSIFSDNPSRGEISMEKRVINRDDINKVEEAKLQAELAAAQAATSIGHCQGVWSQLDKLKNADLTSDAEAMLASAAVTIAAAASVAKAAAAAAQIASEAAVQAKQMADDAVLKHGTANTTRNNIVSLPMFAHIHNLGNATPASILKGGDGNGGSSSIISAVREAARKKVEVASAATRHAQNLDAIVKAAELAAEAVSQAGKVVAMGDPLPLIELAEAGPDGYWKVSHAPSLQVSEPDDMNRNESNNKYVNQHEESDKETVVQRALTRNITDDRIMAEDSLIASVKHRENNSKAQKDRQTSDSAKTIGIVSESDIESRSKSSIRDRNGNTAIITEGCLVEVLKDRDALNKVWYSAKVSSLKDGEALVHYTKLQFEGSEELKEWVPLEAEGDNAPIIRIPHPTTFVQLERTRKRSRAAFKDYAWSVGDRVDACVQDCWHEGMITAKDEKDETSLSVSFPARGETSLIKAWNLRPTLIWSDGQWIEWYRSRQNGSSQGETPQEKRLKRGSNAIESKGKGKMSKDIEFVELGMQEESGLLPLSSNEKVFSIGTTRDENKVDTTRTMRSGLQKDGSKVIFGVPKPGKKRKFMDVSKHYVSDKSNKTNVPSDSVKLANCLMPQGSGSRGWKNSSKIDSKEKQAAESKSKSLNPGKPPIPSRMSSRKDYSTYSKDENESGERNLTAFGTVSNVKEVAEGPVVFSSQASSQEIRKRAPSANTKSDRSNKGKLIPAGRKPANNDANYSSAPEVVEPRRSNRRIQPTSRLLEGLQSSLIISKVPTSSQDKIHRNISKGTSRRE
ncbi:uncharacterized protein LOC111393895 isoform X1 [Olea europaea var. sylvestris]|uniref:uncharacterized protein LOC111393895 isoform X1 n=1 Tax=Olea europaea var. sylvestris TaxID=158386 RepID=UPI000C1D7462|nr:uncharacterized protein LOC111393895 isoform X1 [Olea europaea var. sylvestris]